MIPGNWLYFPKKGVLLFATRPETELNNNKKELQHWDVVVDLQCESVILREFKEK